jgi:hypothetical protein
MSVRDVKGVEGFLYISSVETNPELVYKGEDDKEVKIRGKESG